MKELFIKALKFSVLQILKFIFILPFDLWKKSAYKLIAQEENGVLDMSKIEGYWPFLTYLKRFNVDFFYSAMTFLFYPIGVLAALITFCSIVGDSFGGALLAMISTLFTFYFSPIMWALISDLTQILIIPFRKFISWGSKPAQYMDLEIKNK